MLRMYHIVQVCRHDGCIFNLTRLTCPMLAQPSDLRDYKAAHRSTYISRLLDYHTIYRAVAERGRSTTPSKSEYKDHTSKTISLNRSTTIIGQFQLRSLTRLASTIKTIKPTEAHAKQCEQTIGKLITHRTLWKDM